MAKQPAVKIEIEAVTDKQFHIKYTGEDCERNTACANLHVNKTVAYCRGYCRREGADTISVNLRHPVGIEHLEGSYLITTWNMDIPALGLSELEHICRFPGMKRKYKGRGITTLDFADTFEYREWYRAILSRPPPVQTSGGHLSNSSSRKSVTQTPGKGNDVGNASQGNNRPGNVGQAAASVAPPFYRRLFQAFKGRRSIHQENIRADVEGATTSSSEQNDRWYDAVTDQ